jgi:hypothetical protein
MKKTIIILLALMFCLPVLADSIGMVVSMQGAATAVGEDGASRTLALKSDIFLNDTVTTAAGSKLQILLSDDSIFAQGENSEMTIDEYIYNPAEASDNAFGVKLGQGIFRTVTGKITDLNPDRFAVKTARATIGIRGCDLGYIITPTEDNISIITVPLGKQIFVDPIQGDESATIEVPTVVVVDDEGGLESRPITAEDRTQVQQGTTPQNTMNSGTEDDESGDTTGENTSGDTTDTSSADDGTALTADDSSSSGSGALDNDTVLQDTSQQLTEHLLSEDEINSIINGTQQYNLHGSGTAYADVFVDDIHGQRNLSLSGPAIVNMTIGGGGPFATTDFSLNLTDTAGNFLDIQTDSLQFDGGSDFIIDDPGDIQTLFLETAEGTSWNQGDILPGNISAEGNLYGVDGSSAPTAAEVVNGEIDLESGGDFAGIDFETTRVELHSH